MRRPVASRRAICGAAMLVALAPAVAGFAPAALAQGRLPLTIGWQELPDWLLFVARDMKLFEKAGLAPAFVKFDDGPQMIDAAQRGEIDLAGIGSVGFVAGLSRGLDWTLIGINPEGAYSQGLVARKDGDIRGASDLRGKRVGVVKGSTAHYGLLMLLRQHGLARDRVTLVDLLPAEQVVALKDGAIDAAMTREPWVQRMIHGAAAKLITTEGDLGIYTNVEVYAVRHGWLQANRQTAVRFIQALLMANDVVNRDPGVAVRGWAADMGIKQSWAEAIYQNVPPPLIHEWTNPMYHYGLVKGSPLYRSLGFIATFLHEEKLIPQPVEMDNIMDPTIVTEALRTYKAGR